MREQSQIEAMREALCGDRERAEARRRKARRPGVPRVPTTTKHEPPTAPVDAPAAPPAPTDARE